MNRRVMTIMSATLVIVAVFGGWRYQGLARMEEADREDLVSNEGGMKPLLDVAERSARELSEGMERTLGLCPAFIRDADLERGPVSPSPEDRRNGAETVDARAISDFSGLSGDVETEARMIRSPPTAEEPASLFGVSISRRNREARRRADRMTRDVPLDDDPLVRRYPDLHADLFGWKTVATMDRVDELVRRLTFVDRSDQLSEAPRSVVPRRPEISFLREAAFVVDLSPREREVTSLAPTRFSDDASRCAGSALMRVVQPPL